MISYTLVCKSNYWPARLKKINLLINKSFKFKKELKFNNNIDYHCNMILTNDKLIKKLNLKFRNFNKSTDVLTFISKIKNSKNKYKKICDIFFSGEIIKKDASKNNINFYDHFFHLLIHSFLHINGFTHNNLKNFIKMKKVEIKVLKKIGIENPYE